MAKGKLKHLPMFGKISRPSELQNRKWRVQARASEDKQQMVFCQESSQEVQLHANSSEFATITEKGIDPFKSTTCPFCLSYSQIASLFD